MTIQSGVFGPYALFEPLVAPLWHGDDYYLLAHDFRSYIEAQDRVEQAYRYVLCCGVV